MADRIQLFGMMVTLILAMGASVYQGQAALAAIFAFILGMTLGPT